MKKLKLTALSLGAKEVLTRQQLKNVLGGDDGSGSGSGITCKGTCSGSISTPAGTRSVTGSCDSSLLCSCSITPGTNVGSNTCAKA